MMRRKITIVFAGSALALALGASSAFAQEAPATGTPGAPNCHGQRVSFGSSVFGITPKDRAEFNGISVQQFQERVRESCERPTP
jgi:hypothetical protein